jgi:hypothetical protein
VPAVLKVLDYSEFALFPSDNFGLWGILLLSHGGAFRLRENKEHGRKFQLQPSFAAVKLAKTCCLR